MTRRGAPEREAAGPTYQAALTRVATNLRRLRAARGWTQEETARRCADMAPQYLQLVEREGANLTLSTLARLADGFGIDIGDLLLVGEPLPPRAVGRPRKRDQEATAPDEPPAPPGSAEDGPPSGVSAARSP